VRSDASAVAVTALGAQAVHGDALDRDAVHRAVETVRPDVIVHQLTALPRGSAGPKAMRASLAATSRLRREATRHLADAAETHGVQRLLAQSIAFAYRPDGPMVVDEDHPLDVDARGPWGEVVTAVAELERITRGGAFDGTVLRYGGFYGPGTAVAHDGFVGALAARRRLPVIGSGEGVQSYIHLEDAVSATLAALDGPPGVYNVTDDEPVPAKVAARATRASSGSWAGR
jgi:nucleoside-diphosphate-sugar epimerase